MVTLQEKIGEPETQTSPRARQAQLGQFFTPNSIAAFMADEFPEPKDKVLLLDAGAGQGALTSAFIERWGSTHPISAHMFENDGHLMTALTEQAVSLAHDDISVTVHDEDFLSIASTMQCLPDGQLYTHAILNPPYKKIASSSLARHQIREGGLETVNLYSGFVWLALQSLKEGGQLVAIIPRSFCNGPYYKPFRQQLMRVAAVQSIHLFHSRKDAFSGDKVLQENVILRLERGAEQGPVEVSTSTDASFADLVRQKWDFSEIVSPSDPESFIHIPTSPDDTMEAQRAAAHRLTNINVQVSTGPVVGFRLKEQLRAEWESGLAPLLYPTHMIGGQVEWPIKGGKKPNAIAVNETTKRWLFPKGWYVAVKRFSSKEEKRRIVASLISPDMGDSDHIGLENKLNVLHCKRGSLNADIARGLAIYLNCSAVDREFRRFNGHTQVNATDLRQLSYPSVTQLSKLGDRASENAPATQSEIDQMVEEVLLNAS